MITVLLAVLAAVLSVLLMAVGALWGRAPLSHGCITGVPSGNSACFCEKKCAKAVGKPLSEAEPKLLLPSSTAERSSAR